MRLVGIISAVIGVLLLVLAAAQHRYYFVDTAHAAIYFGLLGLLALVPGAWLTVHSVRSGK
jgi:hypothetical protein